MAVKSAKSNPPAPPDPWLAAMPALALLLLVVIAYLPSLSGQFIWDDDFHVTKCEPLRSLAGLGRIWFEPGATQQFYPLTWTTFWIDFHLWGLNPFPYHAENILLHAINAILVWRILRRLNVTGAWLGAALFALHPVCVESVAWVSERKNTLSGLFFLLCVSAAIKFWLPARATPPNQSREKAIVSEPAFGPWKFFWLTLLLYLCALWCKTVTAVLPGVILWLVWWKRGRWVRKDWLLVLPFLALGLAMGFITAAIEHKFVLDAANADEWKITLPEKFIIAGNALWFYLGKLCWPYPLVFIYRHWTLQPAEPISYLPLAAAMAGGAVLWWKRNSWSRPALIATGYYVIVLLPALGFINIFPFRYSFVADHFQYLAAIGPFALAAAGITTLLARSKDPNVTPVTIAVILILLGALSWRQTSIYQNRGVLWRDTLAHNPNSWMAHDNLGVYLTENELFAEAEVQYREAIKIRPNDHIGYLDLGMQAAILGNLQDAVADFNKSLEIAPDYAMSHFQLANVLSRENNFDGAIDEYHAALKGLPNLFMAHFNLAETLARKGDPDGAIAEYHRTLALQPNYALAHVSLGRALSAKGDIDGAISQYHAALKINPNSVEALANLGNALVSKGQLEEAVNCYHAALQLDPKSSILHFNLSVALSRQGNATDAEAERVKARRLEHP